MNDFFQINSSSSVPIFKRKQAALDIGTDNEAGLDIVVECLQFPNYMRNINDIKKISKWMIKNTELFSKIHSHRLQNDALKNEEEDNLVVAILCSSNVEAIQESQALFNIRDKPEKMYIILEGTVEVFVQPKQQHYLTNLIKSKEICEGKSVGDMDLFSNTNRNSTVITKTKCTLLSIKKNIFDAHILEFYQYYFTDIMNFIFNLKVFDGISNKHLFIKSFYDSYSQQLKYSQGQIVFSEKNQPDYIYFILTGSFLVKRQISQEKPSAENQNQIFFASSQNNKSYPNTQINSEFDLNINDQKIQKIQINLFQLEKGDFFGEEDVIENNTHRTFQVQCSSILGGELLQFNREVFENIFMKHFTIEQFFVLNLPIKRKLIADKIYQNSRILQATIPKDNSKHNNYFDKEKREIRYSIQPSLESMNNIASQKNYNQNYQANQQYDRSVTSLSYIPKNFDEIQEEKDLYDNLKNKNNHQNSQKNFKVNCIGSMSELLDYAQQSIRMLHQNQQNNNSQEQLNQIQDSTTKHLDTLKPQSNKIGLYYLPAKQRISSNDLCYQIENQSDDNLKKQQTINSIKKKMSQTFDYNMNNFMREKIQLQKNVVHQQLKNKQKINSVQSQKSNGQRSKSDENQISSIKRKSKPTVTKWTNSLNQKDEEMVIQGEMSKQFQKNLKQICYKFGKQDFDSLKMSLKNHIKNKNFKKILNANISDAKGFQTNNNLQYDRNKGINDLSEKIQYVQKVQDKMNQKIFNLQSSQQNQQNEQEFIWNQQFNQNQISQLQKSKSNQDFPNYNFSSLDSLQKTNQQSKNDKLVPSTNSNQKVFNFSEKNNSINQISFGMSQSPKSSIDYLESMSKKTDQNLKNADSIDEQQEIQKIPQFNQKNIPNKFNRIKSQNSNQKKQIISSDISTQFNLSQEYQDLKTLKTQGKVIKQDDQISSQHIEDEFQNEIKQNRQQVDNNLTQNKICSIFYTRNKSIEENEKTINSPQSDQNTPSNVHAFSTFQTQYTNKKMQSEQRILLQQKFNKLRPYSSSYHQSPINQFNQGGQNITQNYYPINYYQKTNYITENDHIRPSSCKSRSEKSFSQNFTKLQNSKLNQQLNKQYQFRDKKQMSAFLNVKKQFQNQNKSFSPSNSTSNQLSKMNAQSYLHMIQSHKKYESKELINFESPKGSQFPSSEQLQDNHEKSQKFNNQYCNQNQNQSKTQLNQSINNSLGYFQQYIIHPQQQNIKYHFHRKVISDISKCNINNPQLSKFSQQSSLNNNNNIINQTISTFIKQPAYLQQPQQLQQEKMYKNHSVIMNNVNQQRLNLLQKQSDHQQQAEIDKQESQQNESYPTLFSPDTFYQSQNVKKEKKFINLNDASISQKGESNNYKEYSQQLSKNLGLQEIDTPKQTINQAQKGIQNKQQINKTPKQRTEQATKLIKIPEQAIKQRQQSQEEPQQIIEKLQQSPQAQGQTKQFNEEKQDDQPNAAQKIKIQQNNIKLNIPPDKLKIDFQLMLENQKQKQIEEDNKIESPPLLKSNQTNSYENQTPQFQIAKNFNFQAKQISLNSSIQSQKQSQDLKSSLRQINQDNIVQNNNQENIQKAQQVTSILLITQSEINNSNSLEQNHQNQQFKSNSSIKDFSLQKNRNSQQSIIETVNSEHLTSNQEYSHNKSSTSELSQKFKSQTQIQNKSTEQENQQQKNKFCRNDQLNKKGQQNSQQLFKNTVINSSIPIISEELSFDQPNQVQNNQETLNKLILNGSMTSNISQFQNFIDSPSLVRFRNASQFSTNNINDQTLNQHLIDAPSLIRFRNASQYSINNINDQMSKQNLIDAPSLIRFRNNTQVSTNNINEQISKQSLLFGQNDLVYLTRANKNQNTQQDMLKIPNYNKDTKNVHMQNIQIIDNQDNYPIRQKSKSAYHKL